MKKIQDKEDKLIADIMKDFQAESPPEGFTTRVMQGIETENSISDIYSRPLIGKAGWISIAAGILGIVLFLFLSPDNKATNEAGWLSQFFTNLNLPAIEMNSADLFNWLNLGNSTLYWISIGVAGIGILAVIERMLETLKQRKLYLI